MQILLDPNHQAENPLAASPPGAAQVPTRTVVPTASSARQTRLLECWCRSKRRAIFSWAALLPSAEVQANTKLGSCNPRAFTEANRWFSRPAAICFAGAMLGSSGEIVPALTGIDQGVAQRWQIQSTDVGVGGGLRLLTVVS